MCQADSRCWRQRVNKPLSSQPLPLVGGGQAQPSPLTLSSGLCASLPWPSPAIWGWGEGEGQSDGLGQKLLYVFPVQFTSASPEPQVTPLRSTLEVRAWLTFGWGGGDLGLTSSVHQASCHTSHPG